MGTTSKVTVLVFFTVIQCKISVKSGAINRKILSWPRPTPGNVIFLV